MNCQKDLGHRGFFLNDIIGYFLIGKAVISVCERLVISIIQSSCQSQHDYDGVHIKCQSLSYSQTVGDKVELVLCYSVVSLRL